ncbi:MAG: hypothetical protein ABJG68_10370 [Crocinitomicaceae bacterium]
MITLKLDKKPIGYKRLLSCYVKYTELITEYFFEVPGSIKLNFESDRNYSRIDRCQPPYCPYSDYEGYKAKVNGNFISIGGNRTMWNDNDLSNQSITFMIKSSENVMIAYFSAYSSNRTFEKISLKSDVLDNKALKPLRAFLELVLYMPS